jgi:drug/metabolite transporter (DMT)-like permease
VSDHPSQIRTVLRSCEVEIGTASERPRRTQLVPTHSRTQVVLGFAAIYLIWGSTYLGIRYAVETIPPLLMMGIRHSVAGACVYGWARLRGTPAPQRRQWLFAAIAGGLLFLGSHGTLAWAEQRVPSGLAALLCATLPLWTVLLAAVDGTQRRLGFRALAGILLGFGGVALLIGPSAWQRQLPWLPAAVVPFGTLLWVAGTSYTRRASLPSSKVLSAAMQMISGGALLLIAAWLTGEAHHLQPAAITLRSIVALAFLIVFGSIIAFTVYTWLVTVSSPSMVSTYAYVNPVVAVLIGWALADEPIGWRTIAAAAIILAGVALVSKPGKPVMTVKDARGVASAREALEATGD